MDRDLEDRIDILVQKATKDLKTRIVREVTRSMNKALKEQARGLKSSGGATSKTVRKATASSSEQSTKSLMSKDKYGSDSDDYYSD